ncbi:MAG: nitroreductase family deazaflavin-dependent oxidoreductase [Dehalococcoidia bacterium]
MALTVKLAGQDYCYVTTTGRVTGKPRTIEIWFGAAGDTLYLLSGGRDRSDWVRNMRKTPEVSVRIGRRRFAARARIVRARTKEDALARRLLLEKYARYDDLDDWGRTALTVALDAG